MKWYDYAICFLIADFIASAFMAGNLVAIGVAWMAYDFYEGWRKQN